jgi:integrase/recombinase XerC/integrase/recombinase XerD
MIMGTVHRLDERRGRSAEGGGEADGQSSPDAPTDGVRLGEAVTTFLSTITAASTRKSYGIALGKLSKTLGADIPLATLETEDGAEKLATWFTTTWGQTRPATIGARLDALQSAARYWRAQEWITADPTRRIRRPARPPDRTRALSTTEIDTLLSDARYALRDRTFWRMLYETAARASEVLALDVGGLDLVSHSAKVRRKGGATDVIVWQVGTARLLPRLLAGRRSGPVFLTARAGKGAGTGQLNGADLEPDTGRARLSYRRAEEIFTEATRERPGGPWTLHQLRHSALTHAAEAGTNTPTLLTYSGHSSITSLAKYTRVSAEALARWQQERDPFRRR